MKRIFQSFLSALFLTEMVFFSAHATEPQVNSEVFEVQQFWQTFQDGPEKAEQAFLGKTINISGIVVDTGISIYLTPNVRLSDKSEGSAYVVCVLPRSDTDTLSSYKKGERVAMTGRVYSHRAGERVVIKECRRLKQ